MLQVAADVLFLVFMLSWYGFALRSTFEGWDIMLDMNSVVFAAGGCRRRCSWCSCCPGSGRASTTSLSTSSAPSTTSPSMCAPDLLLLPWRPQSVFSGKS